MKKFICILSILLISFSVFGTNTPVKEKKTAETVISYVEKLNLQSPDQLTPEIQKQIKQEIKTLSLKERIRLTKFCIKDLKDFKQGVNTVKAKTGLFILVIFLPPVAVGIYTDWGRKTLWNFLWTLCGHLPGVVHGIVVLSK